MPLSRDKTEAVERSVQLFDSIAARFVVCFKQWRTSATMYVKRHRKSRGGERAGTVQLCTSKECDIVLSYSQRP